MISLNCLPFFICRYGTFLSFKVGIQPTSIGLKMLPQTSIFARIMLPNYVGRMIHRVAIVGGGIMGTGIAKVRNRVGKNLNLTPASFCSRWRLVVGTPSASMTNSLKNCKKRGNTLKSDWRGLRKTSMRYLINL